MASRDYLKVAAANLRRAATAQKTEADEVRKDAIRISQEAQGKVSDMDKQIKLLQIEMSRLEDDAQRTIVYNQIQKLQSEMEAMNRDAEQLRQQKEREASNMEGGVNDLIGKASDIERRAA